MTNFVTSLIISIGEHSVADCQLKSRAAWAIAYFVDKLQSIMFEEVICKAYSASTYVNLRY